MKTDGRSLLSDLLLAEDEESVVKVLKNHKLYSDESRWRDVGDKPNNQSTVHSQQSNPVAALVEKITNAIDAILLRHVREQGIDPRGKKAPQSMNKAVEDTFGDLSVWNRDKLRELAEDNLILYATGSKSRPCLSLYDAGEGQLAGDFPSTFCSLIHGADDAGSYKGAIPFVQGRFNMGGTGVLPFCGEGNGHKFQLVVSRRAPKVAGENKHEWAFTLFRFFNSPDRPGWKYLVSGKGSELPVSKRGGVLTAGTEPLGLVPRRMAKTSETLAPRERKVEFGTLIKLYDYQAPRGNICGGDLYRKLEDYLLQPALPLRIFECREDYKANLMSNSVWDRIAAHESKLEPSFKLNGPASFSITLSNKETVHGAVRVFQLDEKTGKDDAEVPTGLRAVINGQVHAKRGAVEFFSGKQVGLEHIAKSMLVTLDCTNLSTASRNALFMSNREHFREDVLLDELLKRVREELRTHEALKELNEQRFEQKLKSATNNEAGIDALEELLSTDPDLANLFGTLTSGKVAAPTAKAAKDGKVVSILAAKFEGKPFPTFIKFKDGGKVAEFDIQEGGHARPWFSTDVQNDYFSRKRLRGSWKESGEKLVQSVRLFNGRLTFTCAPPKGAQVGHKFESEVEIKDKKGSGPFRLQLRATVVEAVEREPGTPKGPKQPTPPKADAAPSKPSVREVTDKLPTDPPITILRNPSTNRLELLLNVNSELLTQARELRKSSEHPAVDWVFKYGLALVVMGLLDQARNTQEYKDKETEVHDRIAEQARGVARVIVPLCLSLPGKLPKQKDAAA